MTWAAMGAATRPPVASLPSAPPFSTSTATATTGFCAGAKAMNHAWGVESGPCWAVPVLPATCDPADLGRRAGAVGDDADHHLGQLGGDLRG